MFKKILVPLDGSTLAEGVFPHIVAIAQAFRSECILLRVVEVADSGSLETPVDPINWEMKLSEADAYLENKAELLAQAEVHARTMRREGNAAIRIIQTAREQGVDLIVMSSHGRAGMSPWNVSSVVHKVIQSIPMSFLIVPASEEDDSAIDTMAYERIFIPLDGSQRAEYVLPLITKLAKHHQATMYLTHIVTRPELASGTPLTQQDNQLTDQLVDRNHKAGLKYLEKVQQRLDADSETLVEVCGSIANCLFDLAAKEQADLVAMSAHGYSGDTSRPLGGIARSFIENGNMPLLVVQDANLKTMEQPKAEQTSRRTSMHSKG